MTAPAGNEGQSTDNGGTDASNSNSTEGQQNQFTPIQSQDDLNRIISTRLERERAKYEGFDDFKAKAEQFDQLTEQQKTEQQKLVDRAEAAERLAAENADKATKAELKVLKQKVAADLGLPAKLAAKLSGSNEDEILADAKDSFGDLLGSQSFDHGTRQTSAPASMNDLIFGAGSKR